MLAALGLEPQVQALEDGTPCDVINTEAGPVRLDVSSFFGQGI